MCSRLEKKNIGNGSQKWECTENFRRRPCGYNIWYIGEVRPEHEAVLLTAERNEWQTQHGGCMMLVKDFRPVNDLLDLNVKVSF